VISDSVPHRARRSLRRVCLPAAICALGFACSDATQPHSGHDADAAKLRAGVVVSSPLVPQASGVSTSGVHVDSQVVFVSMPPGTLTGGDSVEIAATNSASSVRSEIMGDGGFDPIPVYSRGADSVEVSVFERGSVVRVRFGVSAARQPGVVRTTPAKGRTDVPLNQKIVIVFTQPMNAATITSSSVQLTLNGTVVPATLSLEVGQPWVVTLSPTEPLDANATYRIAVSQSVTDIIGAALLVPYGTDFTTGSSLESVTSIVVYAPDGFSSYPPSSFAVASPGGTATFVAQEISANGDTIIGGAPLWSTADSAIASVTASGVDFQIGIATAKSAGQTAVIACRLTVCGQGLLRVEAQDDGVAPSRELGDLGGGDSRVMDMKGGLVGGISLLADHSCTHAFVWSAAQGMKDLGALPGQCNSIVFMMNDSGVVSGFGDGAGPHSWTSLWIWRSATGMVPLASPDTSMYWYPAGMNSRAEILLDGDIGHNAILGPDSRSRVIAASIPNSFANGLNDLDQVTLNTLTDLGDSSWCGPDAYVWDAIADRALATLSPRDAQGAPLNICARQINNSGTVAGSVRGQSGVEGAFRWSAAKGFEFLKAPVPGMRTELARLAENGDISVYLESYRHFGADSVYTIGGAIWKVDGSLVRLAGLGGTRTTANGLTSSNLVAGHSQVGSNSGPVHAVLWDLSDASASRAAKSVTQATVRNTPAVTRTIGVTSVGRTPLPSPHDKRQ
jgi:hypothetical protein